LAIRQKIPVLIDPYRQIYFFPTITPSSFQCLWINASQIKAIKASGLDCEIRFNDASVLTLSIGRRSLMKQWKRCQTMEHLVLRSRLEEINPNPILLP
jgi:competence transcription factor ComK